MNELLQYSLTVFIGFFAIMNPIANIPIFLSLVRDADTSTRNRINKKATITAFVIVLIFAILGKFIFEIFGITIPAFKITGGILVFYIGFEMLQSKKSTVKHLQHTAIDENIAISPLAIPILSGPGTLSSAIINSRSLVFESSPFTPTSKPRNAFWKDSWKVRPIAITSPTDFICVVNRSLACANFSKAKRGILVTT